jgi:hypothetical protein
MDELFVRTKFEAVEFGLIDDCILEGSVNQAVSAVVYILVAHE